MDVVAVVREEIGRVRSEWQKDLAQERANWQRALGHITEAISAFTLWQDQCVQTNVEQQRRSEKVLEECKTSQESFLHLIEAVTGWKMQVDAVSRENTNLKASVKQLFSMVNLLANSDLPAALPGDQRPGRGISSHASEDQSSSTTAGEIDSLVRNVAVHRSLIADVTEVVATFNNDLVSKFDEPVATDGSTPVSPASPEFEKFEMPIGRLLPQQGVGALEPIAEGSTSSFPVDEETAVSCRREWLAPRSDDAVDSEPLASPPSVYKECNKRVLGGNDTDYGKLWAQDLDVAGKEIVTEHISSAETVLGVVAESVESQEESIVSYDSGGEPMIFVAENDHLNAEGPGLIFRNSISLKDTDEERAFVPWGSIVYGTPVCENRWLQVGRRFLPMQVDGMSVLRSPSWKPRS